MGLSRSKRSRRVSVPGYAVRMVAGSVIASLGCAPGEDPDFEDGLSGGGPAATEMSTVGAEVVSVALGRRPPVSVWTFDLTLENGAAEPRWLVVPDPPETSFDQAWGANGVGVFAVGAEEEHVTMVEIQGTPGLIAFLLAPRARIELSGISLRSWQEEPLTHLEVRAVSDLMIGYRPPGSYSVIGLTNEGTSVVDASVKTELNAWADENLATHPVSFETRRSWTVALQPPAG